MSDETHLFAGEQYIAVGISTKEYEASLSLADSFVDGELTRESFAAPWAVVSLRDADIERAVARVTDALTERAAERMAAFAGRRES